MSNNLKNVCNEKVFESVFNTHAKNLKRFIFSKTRDRNLAEDIIQDAFVKIWEDCDKVVFDTVKSYLYTIANNLFLEKSISFSTFNCPIFGCIFFNLLSYSS